MGVVDPLSREQELPELGAVESAGVAGVDLGSANVLSRVRGDTTVDVAEAVEAADRREPAVDGGGSQATSLHGPHVQLDLWPGGLQDVQAVVGRPLEERPQVIAVGLQRAFPVAGQEGSGSQFGFVDRSVPLGGALDLWHGHQFGHWNLPELVRSPANLLAEGCAVPTPGGMGQLSARVEVWPERSSDDLEERDPFAFSPAARRSGGLGPCESGGPVEPGELVWVADGVDVGDAPVLDGEAHGGVDLPADVEPDGG